MTAGADQRRHKAAKALVAPARPARTTGKRARARRRAARSSAPGAGERRRRDEGDKPASRRLACPASTEPVRLSIETLTNAGPGRPSCAAS